MQEKGNTIVTSWELGKLNRADLFVHFARAYLDCSHYLFTSMIEGSIKPTFSHARAAGFLFEHSLELFFKGAIIQAGKKPTITHDLSQLYREFKNLYPGKKFSFKAKVEEVCSEDTQRPYSEYSRYPVDSAGNLWSKPSFYDLHFMASQLILFKNDYVSIMSQIKGDNS
jgi:hypothetical protein